MDDGKAFDFGHLICMDSKWELIHLKAIISKDMQLDRYWQSVYIHRMCECVMHVMKTILATMDFLWEGKTMNELMFVLWSTSIETELI